MCGCTTKAMQGHWKSIGSRFRPHPTEAGRLISPRIEDEREKAIAKAEEMAARGRQGATRRWQIEREKKARDEMQGHSSSIDKQSPGSATPMQNDASFTLHPSPLPFTPLPPAGEGSPAGGTPPPVPRGGDSNPMSFVTPELRAPLGELLAIWDPAKALPRSAAIAFGGEVLMGDATGREIVACARMHMAAFTGKRRQYLTSLPKWLAEGGYRVYLPTLWAQAGVPPTHGVSKAQEDFYGFTREQWNELEEGDRDRIFREYWAARGVKWDQDEETAAAPLQTAASS